MGTTDKKEQKKILAYCKKQLKHYEKLYLADNHISKEEQLHLNKLLSKINKCEKALDEISLAETLTNPVLKWEDDSSAMGNFFSEIKKYGTFNWEYKGDTLRLSLLGAADKVGYDKTSLDISLFGGINATSQTEIAAKNIDLEAKLGLGGSGTIDANLDGINRAVGLGVTIEDDGNLKARASYEIKDIINFSHKSGNVKLLLEGDESSWKFTVELASSGGKAAHLSHTAIHSLKKTMYAAAHSVEKIYKILLEKHHPTSFLEKIAPYKDSIAQAASTLWNDMQTPAKPSEVFISFGLGSDKNKDGDPEGVALTVGFTYTF